MLFQPLQQYHRHSFNSSRRNMIGTTWTIFRHHLDNLDATLGHPWEINFETALGLALKNFETISGQRWDSIEIACGQLWDNLDTTLGYLDTTFWQHENFWPNFETNWKQLWDNFFGSHADYIYSWVVPSISHRHYFCQMIVAPTSETGSMKVLFLFFFSASAWALGQDGRKGWVVQLDASAPFQKQIGLKSHETIFNCSNTWDI